MPSSQFSKSNKSLSLSKLKDALNENDMQRLQREVDTYTRELESEKRRLFGIEETYNIVSKEYRERLKVIEKLKSPIQAKNKQIFVHIKSLESQLEQAIVKYNEILSINKKLRNEVDVIRRERVSLVEVRASMGEELIKAKQRLFELKNREHQRSGLAIELHHKIAALRDKNEEEQDVYLSEYRNLQMELREEKKKAQNNGKNNKNKERPENFDTHAILKRRLQRIIYNNREKVKVIDQYQKNMKIIDEAFNIIKETSGITDIEEIMNTFIKSEEQNYSLFNYVNVLTQDMDFLEENNKDLEREIADMEVRLEERERLLQMTPPDEIERQKIQDIINEKDNFIRDVRSKLSDIKGPLEEVLKSASGTKLTGNQTVVIYDDFVFNENTLEQYLSQLEAIVNRMLPYVAKINNNKDYLTAGLLLDDVPVKEFESKDKEREKVKIVNAPNINMKETAITEDSTLETNNPINENQLREYALTSVQRYKSQQTLSTIVQENGRHQRDQRFNTRIRPDLTEKY